MTLLRLASARPRTLARRPCYPKQIATALMLVVVAFGASACSANPAPGPSYPNPLPSSPPPDNTAIVRTDSYPAPILAIDPPPPYAPTGPFAKPPSGETEVVQEPTPSTTGVRPAPRPPRPHTEPRIPHRTEPNPAGGDSVPFHGG